MEEEIVCQKRKRTIIKPFNKNQKENPNVKEE